MWFENYSWNNNYSLLALEQGFTFERRKTVCKDKNKIALLDIEEIIVNNDVKSIEKLLPFVVQYNVDGSDQLLDQSFVKTFRICQLLIEYLLFCKMHLDGSIPMYKQDIKKLQEENTELKLFNEELKTHVNRLINKLKMKENTTTFKCNKCSKAFASENFLLMHNKRRHFNIDTECETEKINLETTVKELKQKLNQTEKLIKLEESKTTTNSNENHTKVSELHLKLESFQNYVEQEIQYLKSQNSLEEKYTQLLQNTLEAIQYSFTQEKKYQMQNQNASIQIENYGKNKLVQDDYFEMQTNAFKQIPQLFEDKFNAMHGNITSTITNSLKQIEFQMQALWQKVQEIEQQDCTNEINSTNLKSEDNPIVNYTKTANGNKSIIKKRYENILTSKVPDYNQNRCKTQVFNKTKAVNSKSTRNKNKSYSEKVSNFVDPEQPAKNKIDMQQSENINSEVMNNRNSTKNNKEVLEESENKTFLSSHSGSGAILNNILENVQYDLDDILSVKKIQSIKNSTEWKKKIESAFYRKLQEYGLSNEWKGIPKLTFQKTIDLIKQKTLINEKQIPQFKKIRKQIIKVLETDALEKLTLKDGNKIKYVLGSTDPCIADILKRSIAFKAISEENNENTTNKLFYSPESSDEDIKKKIIKNVNPELNKPFSAVIKELKQSQSQNMPRKLNEKQDDIKSFQNNGNFINDKISSVTMVMPKKKKVLFTLEDSSKYNIELGSTSLESSFLDTSEEK